MTSGIYALVFTNCDLIYIGQSINIEKRFKEHIYSFNRGDANKKLLEAYKTYNTPELFILEETCQDLDSLELHYISKFDTVKNGLNEWAGPIKVLRGQAHPNSKYTNKQIEDIIILLSSDEILSFKEIAKIVNVPISTVQNVSSGKVGSHLKNSFPKEYTILENRRNNRISEASSARGRGISYPIILSPNGEEYNIENITKFAEKWGLNRSHLCGVLNGVRKSHKGWRLK